MKPAERLYRVVNALALELPEAVHKHAKGEIMAAFDAAVADEREACAKLADEQYGEPGWCGDYKTAATTIAGAIRARNPEGV